MKYPSRYVRQVIADTAACIFIIVICVAASSLLVMLEAAIIG